MASHSGREPAASTRSRRSEKNEVTLPISNTVTLKHRDPAITSPLEIHRCEVALEYA